MKRKKILDLRKTIEKTDINDWYIAKVRKAKNGDLVIPLPKDIVRTFDLKADDKAMMDIIDKACFVVTFVKKIWR